MRKNKPMSENNKPVTPKDLNAVISYNELHMSFRDPLRPSPQYRHVRIEVPIDSKDIGDEYELNFAPEDTDEKILSTPIKSWRVI